MISEKELYEMYFEKQMSMIEIARRLNVGYTSIRYWLNKYGIEKRSISEARVARSRNNPIISKEELYRFYYEKEMTMSEISDEINVTLSHIIYAMKKHGIERRNISGKSNGSWKGGISFEPYCDKFNREFKNIIRNRDNDTCQLCGHVPEPNNKKLSIHHIHYDKKNCEPDVIALCNSCNSSVNNNRDRWEKHFEELLRSRGLLYN